jgi:hypothetical protein
MTNHVRKILLLPGLGADARMYDSLLTQLPNAKVFEWRYVEGCKSLKSYAEKMAEQFAVLPDIIIGTSLGGMMAIELSKFIQPEKLILISTAKTRKELPPHLKILKHLPIHKLLSGKAYKTGNEMMARSNRQQNEESASLIIDMGRKADARFVKWAIDAVLKWDNQLVPEQYIHIHGTSDALFPIRYIQNPIPVMHGTHVMSITKKDEVNRLIVESLR